MLRLGLARASRPAARLPALACAARHFSAATGATSGTFAKTLFREPDPSKPRGQYEDLFWGATTFKSLQAVKAKWDPTAVFDCHQCVYNP